MAGTYLDGDIDNFSYGAAPKVGLVFPLGNSAFTNQFWSRTAIVAGIYLDDFEDEFDNNISGPVVGKPIYAGLGYNIFRFVRLNAGISVLEDKKTVGGNLSTLENRVFVRPFISLTADINLWMDLAK